MSIYTDNSELIDTIISKCHKLRSALVQTILENDPFYTDSICDSKNEIPINLNNLSKQVNEIVKAYLRGDNLTKQDENLALSTLKNLSVQDLYRITNTAYSSEPLSVTKEVENKPICSEPNVDYLKFVDSIRISVKCLNLNETGTKKLNSNKFSNETFFVEYKIPDLIRTKTDSVRICSRRTNKIINFKQTTIHDIHNLAAINLNLLEMKFQVSCRCLKQKTPIDLGEAKFNFKYFINSKTFSCLQEQALKINDAITVGTLLIGIQLGYGRLYFGKDFLNAVKEEKPIILQEKLEDEQKIVKIPQKVVLFGFVGVFQAEFYHKVPFSSFVVITQSFYDDSFISRTVYNNCNPVYNFRQYVPFVYNKELVEKFHNSFIIVEFWKKGKTRDFIIGITKLSLNQFFLSCRDSVFIKYLMQKQLPVIGTDCWETIHNPVNDEIIGQVELLVALGTQEQINFLENERKKLPQKRVMTSEVGIQSDLIMEEVKAELKKTEAPEKSEIKESKEENKLELKKTEVPKIVELQKSVTKPELRKVEKVQKCEEANKPELRKTADLLETLEIALETRNTFKVEISIISALHLPVKRKKSKKRKEDLPSTYVTFEVNNNLKCTGIVAKNANPEWNYKCITYLPIDYLQEKKLIFKIWKKSTNINIQQPNYQTDVIIGFAALDLSVLASGLPNIQAWFNIVDFSGKTNGQVNIHVKPLENLQKYQKIKSPVKDITESNELLSNTLKRKFTELDEITQRLRLRLSKVTNDESDYENDEVANEFERDINTLCVEDDFDMINFTDGCNNDRNESDLLKTDLMLDKLNLTSDGSENSFNTVSTTRYVSGCSTSRLESNENLMEDLDRDSRPNIYTFGSFNKMMDTFYGVLDEKKE